MKCVWIMLLIICIFIYLQKSHESLLDMSKAENYFDKNIDIYVINLKRSRDRMKTIDKLLRRQNIKYTRIEGIDGKALKLNKDKDRGFPDLPKNRIGAGTRGIWLTNLRIFEKILSKPPVEYVIIFEDDAIIPSDFKKNIYDLIQRHPKMEAFRLQNYYSNLELKDQISARWGLTAQMYKRSIIEELYNKFQPNSKFVHNYDILYGDDDFMVRGTSDLHLFGILHNHFNTMSYPLVGVNTNFESLLDTSMPTGKEDAYGKAISVQVV